MKNVTGVDLWSVWPDVGIKSSPHFPNNGQQVATAVSTNKVMLFTVA